jgi:DNA-binding response OmpR family regulator
MKRRCATTAPEALRQFVGFRPAAVVLDIGMPGLSGYQVASSIRQQLADAVVLLIAVTGW